MATIKSYTDISQSKVLAEILPLKSADMYYLAKPDDTNSNMVASNICIPRRSENDGQAFGEACAWSLAALLEQLKSEIQLENKQILFLHINKYDDIDYDIRYTNSWTGGVLIAEADNLVDACYKAILELNELNLL